MDGPTTGLISQGISRRSDHQDVVFLFRIEGKDIVVVLQQGDRFTDGVEGNGLVLIRANELIQRTFFLDQVVRMVKKPQFLLGL